MALVYRSMLPDGDVPKFDASKNALGVKVGSGEHDDIPVDGNGRVHPATGGMSVASHWTLLPLHRIPRRLNRLVPGARGNSNCLCWKFGKGQFCSGLFSESLSLRVDSDRHALVEPNTVVDADVYHTAIAATQPGWQIDEELT